MSAELRVVTGFYMWHVLHFSFPLILIFFKLILQLFCFSKKGLKFHVEPVDLFFVYLLNNSHVFAQSVVFLFKKSILLLKLDVSVEKFSCLFSISALGQTWMSLRHDTFHDTRFLGQSQSIRAYDFPRTLWRCLADVSTDIGVSACVIDTLCSVIQEVIIQKVWVWVVV